MRVEAEFDAGTKRTTIFVVKDAHPVDQVELRALQKAIWSMGDQHPDARPIVYVEPGIVTKQLIQQMIPVDLGDGYNL